MNDQFNAEVNERACQLKARAIQAEAHASVMEDQWHKAEHELAAIRADEHTEDERAEFTWKARAVKAEVDLAETQNVLASTRRLAIDSMDEIRLAAGAPISSDDSSANRAIDYVKGLAAELAAAKRTIAAMRPYVPFTPPDSASIT